MGEAESLGGRTGLVVAQLLEDVLDGADAGMALLGVLHEGDGGGDEVAVAEGDALEEGLGRPCGAGRGRRNRSGRRGARPWPSRWLGPAACASRAGRSGFRFAARGRDREEPHRHRLRRPIAAR